MQSIAAYMQYAAAFAVNLILPWIIFRFWGHLVLLSSMKGIFSAGLFVAGLYQLRIYIKGSQFQDKSRADGLVILVTGANCGIGFALTKLLNDRGAHVHLLCRSTARGREALYKLQQLGCDSRRLTLHIADLSDLQSVKDFCIKFKKEETKLDVLVCNAGVMAQTVFTKTVDGHEITYQTNFLAHHLLTELLQPILSENGRIVNISSIMHLYGDSVRSEYVHDPKGHAATAGMQAYNRSKLAQVMMTRELASQLKPKQKIVSCHPGNVYSNILENGPLGFLSYTWTRLLIAFVLKSEEDGAQTPLYACLSPDLVSGEYYRECGRDENVNPLVNKQVERSTLLRETREALRPFLMQTVTA